jgi:hypothetical protein
MLLYGGKMNLENTQKKRGIICRPEQNHINKSGGYKAMNSRERFYELKKIADESASNIVINLMHYVRELEEKIEDVTGKSIDEVMK